MLEINDFIGQSRSLIKDVKDGKYQGEETQMARMTHSTIRDAAMRYNSKYSKVIDRFNYPLC